MKIKTLYLVLTAFFLSACASSTYQKMPPPNLQLSFQNLQFERIDPVSLVGVYVSFTTAGQFYKDSRADREEAVDAGVYIQHDILSGESLYQPLVTPVLYLTGKDQGKPVRDKRTGKILTDDFLGEIVSVEIMDGGLPLFWVHIDSPTGGAILPFGLRESPKQKGRLQDKFVLMIDNKSVSSGGKNFFPITDLSGQTWFAQNPGMGLSKIYFAKSSENQSTSEVGTSKKVGLPAIREQ
ncbi:MAG: hypothetical protein PHC89_01495 [Candidatus Pacebacteria bacterium]|nr:hypothetical protein [Candidatus Paceibacterota bacterium]